jgi:hypothetical protein
MDHLAPPARIAGASQPAAPVGDGGFQELPRLLGGMAVGLVAAVDVLEDEGRTLPRVQLERRMDVAVSELNRGVGLQRQRAARCTEQRTVRVALELVWLAAVVEARGALQLEVHGAANGYHAADQPLSVPAALSPPDRHEVLHLAYPSGVRKRVINTAVSGK